jgi:hypothetical protein
VTRTRLAAVALAAALLAGCGAVVRVAYNNADYAVRVAAHDWFDLHGEQSTLVRTRIEDFHAWHRREELPRYGRLFGSAADRVARGLNREDVEWALASVRERYQALAAHAAEDLVPVFATFTQTNYTALERKFAEDNEKLAKEYVSVDPAKRDRNRFKAIVNRFEDWTGPLSDEQEALIRTFVRAGADVTEARLADRKRRQRELLQLLETYRTSPELGPRLTAYLVNWENARGPEYARLARAREEQLIQLLLDIDRTLTSKQRAHAVAKLRAYADDWYMLAGQGRKEPPAGMKTAEPRAVPAGG